LTLFVLIIATKGNIIKLQQNLDLKETTNFELNLKKDKLKNLNKLRNKLESSSESIDKYLVELKEDELINYIYSYIEDTNSANGVIIVKSISI
jgi:hypothetical protein